MKRKLLVIVALIAVVFVTAVLWRVDGFIFGDRMNWAEAQARSQMGSLHQALQAEVKSLERIIYSFNSDNFRKEKISWSSLQPYYAIASLAVGTQGDVLTQNLLTKEKSPAAKWTPEFLNKSLGRIDIKGASGLQVFVKSFQDGEKGRHVALIFTSQGKAYALVGAGELFQSLIDSQKGSLNSISIVNKEGLTIGHSTPEYVGTLLSGDPVYKVAKESGVSQGVGVYDSSDGQKIFGVYDQIPQTNLILLSSSSVNDLMKGRSTLLWQFLLLGFGLVFVGVAGLLLVLRPHEKSLEQLHAHAQALVAGKKDFVTANLTSDVREIDELLGSINLSREPVREVVTHKVPVERTPDKSLPPLPNVSVSATDPEKAARDILNGKMEAYRSVASALGFEMRGPLTSILGYSQMVLARSQDPEVVSSVDSILRESRSARDILDKLFSFAGEETLVKNEMKLEGPLLHALKNLDALFAQKGVKVEKNISENKLLPLSVRELTRAFENILRNSVEAMERMSRKEIKIQLFEQDDGTHLEIGDSGEGIEAGNIAKIFDPFFTTRSFQNHTGLGLAVAMGILKEHSAEIEVYSERGVGTQVHIVFRREAFKPALPVVPLTLIESLHTMSEEIAQQDIPTPLAAPPSAIEAAQQEQILALTETFPTPSQDFSVPSLPFDHSNPPRPPDVNIDALLDLPPEVPKRPRSSAPELTPPSLPPAPHPAAQQPGPASGSLQPPPIPAFLKVQPPPAPPATPPPQMIRDFSSDEDATQIGKPVPIDVLAAPEEAVAEARRLAEAPLDEEVPVGGVAPPRMAAPVAKKSKLDQFAVDIPKPGKRS